MADNQDADIDEIVGQEDLELDELDNESKEEGEQAEEPQEKGEEKEGEKDTDSSEKAEEDSDEKPKDDEEGDKKDDEEEPPKPLTKEDIQAAFQEARENERNSSKEVEELTNEVLQSYYPDGLSNVLVDKNSGKELRTPQDVIDASGGELSYEDAWRWLNNEQQKLDQQVNQIKDEARNIAETNANFNSGIERVIGKYGPVFDAFKDQKIQEKVYKAYMKNVKMDDKKNLVLSAPDIEEFYDLVMEPYLLAYGNMQTQNAGQQSGQQPAPAQGQQQPQSNEAPQIPDSKPSIEDRLDESGDGGGGGHEADPNSADEKLNELFGE